MADTIQDNDIKTKFMEKALSIKMTSKKSTTDNGNMDYLMGIF